MLHYLGVLNLPRSKPGQDRTPAFGPERTPGDSSLGRAETGSALFSGREPSDGGDPEPHESPRFASMLMPVWY